MDLVTIYRTLNLFEEKGIIREILSKDDTKYYEISCVHNPVHPHLYCRRCKTLSCLGELKEKDLINLKKYGVDCSVDDISIQFTGVCSKCR